MNIKKKMMFVFAIMINRGKYACRKSMLFLLLSKKCKKNALRKCEIIKMLLSRKKKEKKEKKNITWWYK